MITTTTTNSPGKTLTTYAAAYAQLSAVAERLKGAGTASSIDTLAEDVRAARQAYDVCRSRLEAIRAEIDAEVTASADVPS